MANVKFTVSAVTEGKDVVGIVGDRPEIGEWRLEGAKVMQFDVETRKWKTDITFGEVGNVNYRYLILCNVPNEDGIIKPIVRKWEASIPTMVRTVDVSQRSEIEDGEFGLVGGKAVVDQGWICGQTEIRFNISEAGKKPIILWRGKSGQTYETLQIFFESDSDTLKVQARMIKPYQFTELDPTESVKLPKKEEEVLTFITEVMNLETFSGRFVISDANKKILGCANVIGDQLSSSIAEMKLAILNNKGVCIGSLRLEYMVITSYGNDAMTMESSYATYWHKRPTLHIGHRGSGNSFTSARISDLFENTISSFRKAALHGAAMIEFDVQLTKDKVPIVFHDFTVCTAVASKIGERPPSLHEMEISSFTYEELQNYMTHHRSRKYDTRDLKYREDDPHPHFRPFPTLVEVFESVPEEVGFDVELKWPHFHQDETWYHGVQDFGDPNNFVDKIFDDVFKCAGKRRIAFSCFEANICTLLRRKQNRYPVFLITCGDAYKGDKFMELRSRFNSLAIPFSCSEKFLGLCTEDSAAYQDKTLIAKVHDADLVCFLYGDDIADPENRDLLIKQEVDGIIYDRIHEARPEGLNIYQLEAGSSLNG